jgi:hypothetical protein
MRLLLTTLPGILALCLVLGAPANSAVPCGDFRKCQVTANATIDATITTIGAFGELWEYHVHSGGAVTLHVTFFLSPTGELSGSFNLDPGEINYVICEADAAGFFSLPRLLQKKGDAVMLDGPALTISITRGGTTTTVHVDDPADLRNQDEVARFLRVWDRIFKPLPIKPLVLRASNNRSRGP